MDPISNQSFSYDYQKYVYQDPNVRIVNQSLHVAKPFELKAPEKSKKTKKDIDKRKQKEDKKNPS